jgi:putative transposase
MSATTVGWTTTTTRADGQEVLLAVTNIGGKTSAAWRAVLDDLLKRGLRKPQFLIVDGWAGLERALASLWLTSPPNAAPYTSTNLLAHAPKRPHDEISAEYNDMIYATRPRTSSSAGEPSCADGGSNARSSPTACRK